MTIKGHIHRSFAHAVTCIAAIQLSGDCYIFNLADKITSIASAELLHFVEYNSYAYSLEPRCVMADIWKLFSATLVLSQSDYLSSGSAVGI